MCSEFDYSDNDTEIELDGDPEFEKDFDDDFWGLKDQLSEETGEFDDTVIIDDIKDSFVDYSLDKDAEDIKFEIDADKFKKTENIEKHDVISDELFDFEDTEYHDNTGIDLPQVLGPAYEGEKSDLNQEIDVSNDIEESFDSSFDDFADDFFDNIASDSEPELTLASEELDEILNNSNQEQLENLKKLFADGTVALADAGEQDDVPEKALSLKKKR